MPLISMTTPHASYEVDSTNMDRAALINRVTKLHKNIPSYHIMAYDSKGTLVAECGKHTNPTIWTHTLVPWGLDIIGLHEHFETKILGVLGDVDTIPDLRKCTNKQFFGYDDNRYFDVTIRAAWMMYVDQAIDHFKGKL